MACGTTQNDLCIICINDYVNLSRPVIQSCFNSCETCLKKKTKSFPKQNM
jgi:hypothetical protein